jgi:hypothetical protein
MGRGAFWVGLVIPQSSLSTKCGNMRRSIELIILELEDCLAI